MPPREIVDELILVTYAVAKAVEQANIEELAQLMNRRQELVDQIGDTLDDEDKKTVSQAQTRAHEALALQKHEVSKQISDLFNQRRSRKAYRAA